MCLLNAYILCKTQVGESQQPSLRQFSLTVVTQLLQKFGQVTAPLPRRHSNTFPDQLKAHAYMEKHFAVPLPPSNARNVGLGHCYICSHTTLHPKRRKNTSYRCHKCRVPLCIVPCLKEFYTDQVLIVTVESVGKMRN
ncbi:hypothetical protein Pcinc_032488 [Petrolisthes cinctipes]|uniref:PiggyBac transposable element-derived protein 4 C-terminal zinc-ribbon domain-containing protein n=1 Tax=Petrolisthes cinctipes TaxID=88211 RepID=A0AAE1JZ50_PETCI|nr:hypothetical protein Pcinc_032488 [Petrolisthes cinctipes]